MPVAVDSAVWNSTPAESRLPLLSLLQLVARGTDATMRRRPPW